MGDPTSTTVAAVDLGASSGRVMVGQVGPGTLRLEEVTRFPNDPVRTPDGLHWNVAELYARVLEGIRRAARASGGSLTSVGVDSWAVDYALVRDGRMLGLPYHYRDEGRTYGVDVVHRVVGPEELYPRNGLQFLPFNTIYQLAADPWVADADVMLLVPDLLAYWLTGRMVAERTNASTTGLLDVRTRQWDTALAARLGVPDRLLPDLVDPGESIGPLLRHVADEVGQRDLRVTAVGSHDTASAVVGVPIQSDDAAYVSIGTWGLVGVELEEPVVSEASRDANFTNEGGVDGTVRFLTNVMGMWLLDETLRTWESRGQPASRRELLDEAAGVREVPVFDVQDERFLPPGDMPARIADWFAERGLRAPDDPASLVRSVVESLAQAFSEALERAESLSGYDIRVVHVVGGGAQNRLLCQSLADRSGCRVLAGPVEATALGNVLVQARAEGAVGGSLTSMRGLIAATHEPETFLPRSTAVRMGP